MTDIHARPFYDSPTRRQKEEERLQLEADVAKFRKAGGRVQVLDTTAIDKKGISRRQVVEGGADRRKAAKKRSEGMSGHYEITVSITALCVCCGKELPESAYLTESRASEGVFDRDNPHERKDRRVFIAPCADCFVPRGAIAELIAAADRLERKAVEQARLTSSVFNTDLESLRTALAGAKGGAA